MTRDFSVLLGNDGLWDALLDGQTEHLGLDDSGLLDFAQQFRAYHPALTSPPAGNHQ
jgi:hypothetical protein